MDIWSRLHPTLLTGVISGVIAFYYNVNNAESHLHPYLTLAFGQYNTTNNKWEMMPIVNSSASLPVKSKDGNDDYNIGDFLTIKNHKGRDQEIPVGYEWIRNCRW